MAQGQVVTREVVEQVRSKGKPENIAVGVKGIKNGYLVSGTVTWFVDGNPILTQTDEALASDVLDAGALVQLWLDKQTFVTSELTSRDEEAE